MKKKLLFIAISLTLVATLGFFSFKPQPTYRYPFAVNRTQANQDEFKLILDAYEKRHKRNPTGFQNMAALAALYLDIAKRTGMESYFEKAKKFANQSLAEMSLQNIQAKLVIADLYQATHEFNESLKLTEEILKEKFNQPDALLLQTKSYLALGDILNASQAIDKLIDHLPSQSAYLLKGTILAQQQRNDEAAYNYMQALKLDEIELSEQAAYGRAIFARFQLNVGNNQEAKKLIDEALRIDPQSSLALDQLGEYYLNKKSFSDATDVYKLAFQKSKQVLFFYKEAKARHSNGEIDKASKMLTQAEILMRIEMKNKPNSHLTELADLLIFRNKKSDLQEALKLTVQESKLRRNPETLTLLAKAFMLNQKPHEARKIIRELLAKNIKNKKIINLAISIETELKNNDLAAIYKNQF